MVIGYADSRPTVRQNIMAVGVCRKGGNSLHGRQETEGGNTGRGQGKIWLLKICPQ
jgi:hypothetical protein